MFDVEAPPLKDPRPGSRGLGPPRLTGAVRLWKPFASERRLPGLRALGGEAPRTLSREGPLRCLNLSLL